MVAVAYVLEGKKKMIFYPGTLVMLDSVWVRRQSGNPYAYLCVCVGG